MNLDYGLKLELNQKLVMTPELRQAIAILQLSSLELSDMIEEQLQENPVLEIEEPTAEKNGEDESADTSEQDNSTEVAEWLDYFDEDSQKEWLKEAGQGPHENVGLRTVSLHEHLEFQLNFTVLDKPSLAIGRYLIGCINDNGYLMLTLEEAAKQLKQPEELVERMLHIIQTFDPSGVGARDLKECLRLQLSHKQIKEDLVEQIIEYYLDEVAAGKCKLIAEKLHTSPVEVQEAIDLIKTLDPKPGRAFGSESDPGYISPDVTVEKINGQFVILVNDSLVPRLTINPYYRHVVKEAGTEAKKFIEGRLSAALWLIKSIEQRRRTLAAVMEQIVEFQHDFFEYGPKYIKPLTMKKVADGIQMHESTVSRAIANKYVATSHGLFALRTFFSSSVHSATGEDVAASKAKDELKDLIAAENPKKPYSDQMLSELLGRKNLVLSRRTVTKYREELGIPSSSKRKRY
ncbi:MAG: RNA polymerase factor sigma-54 [Sporomusaceae bacterium]|nr:RNA polymerase factor sigma-54 [Sporomusaceae bacterium]